MEFRQLEYFLAVKNAGSFTRAAEHLYVSQPAVTSAIRSLESELGITLFDRSQGKASLTAEGRIFSAHVEEIMKGVVTTICDMDAMKSLSSGTLAIGISSFLSLPSVLSLIARFLSDHPGIECRVQEGPAEAVAALLEKGELDGAFLPEDPGAGYDIHPLAEVPLALILPKSHPLAEKSLMGRPRRHGLVPPRRLRKRNETLSRVHRVLTAGSADTIRGLLLAMDSAAILPASIFEGDSRLAEIPLAPEIVISPVYAENARRTPSRAARAFSDSIN